jgi:hypothetical protein
MQAYSGDYLHVEVFGGSLCPLILTDLNSASAAALADARHARSFSAVGFFRVGVAIARPFHL